MLSRGQKERKRRREGERKKEKNRLSEITYKSKSYGLVAFERISLGRKMPKKNCKVSEEKERFYRKDYSFAFLFFPFLYLTLTPRTPSVSHFRAKLYTLMTPIIK
jgi:hypothetical protein